MERGKNHVRGPSLSSEDDSSSSEDDENAELLTEQLEEGFFKVLSQLKKKDSKLYEESVRYFPANTLEGNEQTDSIHGEVKINEEKHYYKEWLKGQAWKVEDKEIENDLKALHDFWTNPDLNKDEQFLRDYILDQKFLEPDDDFNMEEEIKKLSEEEKEVDEELAFEYKYNCRFENSVTENNSNNHISKKNKNGNKKENITTATGNLQCSEEEIVRHKKKKKANHMTQSEPCVEETKGKHQAMDNLPRNLQMKKKKRKKKIRHQNTLMYNNVQATDSLPRNLQMKNGKRKKKIRHRNTPKTGSQINEKNKDKISKCTLNNETEIKVSCQEKTKPFKTGPAVKVNARDKKNYGYQSKIVKEKKNKELKFKKIQSKKHKATKAFGKSMAKHIRNRPGDHLT